MGKINVLQLVEDFGGLGGSEKVVYDLVSRISRDQFDVAVCVVNPRVLPRYYKNITSKIIGINGTGTLSFGTIKGLVEIIKSERIDLIHSHLFRMNSHNWIAGKYSGIPSIASIHGIMRDELSLKMKLLAKLTNLFCYKIITVSENIRTQYIDLYGGNPAKIKTIHNTFDNDRISGDVSEEDIAQLREKAGISENDPVLAAIGNIRPEKGYEYLIDAVSILKNEYPNIRLLIAGGGADNLGLSRRIADSSLDSNITLLGDFRNIAALFKLADIYVSSSVHEGFSLTTLEAMAYGLPVIVTDCGGPGELVEHGKNGLVVAVGSAEAIAEGVSGLIADSSGRAAFGQIGRKIAFEKFSPERFIEEHQKIYREAVEDGRP